MINTDFFKDLESLKVRFALANTFPHLIIDKFLNEEMSYGISQEFSDIKDMEVQYYESKFQFEPLKLISDNILANSKYIKSFVDILISNEFSYLLTEITDIPNLFLDKSFNGGLIHQAPFGIRVGVHLDREVHGFNKNWVRKITMIVYFNLIWNNDWHGDLQFWRKSYTDDFYTISDCFKKNIPCF